MLVSGRPWYRFHALRSVYETTHFLVTVIVGLLGAPHTVNTLRTTHTQVVGIHYVLAYVRTVEKGLKSYSPNKCSLEVKLLVKQDLQIQRLF